jgi:hypothetical protein
VVNSYTYAELDFFRYLFGETGEVFQNGRCKLYLDDFRRFDLPINWYKFIYSSKGDGHYSHNKNNTFIIAPRKPVHLPFWNTSPVSPNKYLKKSSSAYV